MKRITALFLSLIISFSVCVFRVYAEEAAPNTRMQTFIKISELMNIKPDGDIMPLLAYNDWAFAASYDRYTAAAVIKSGIFVPDTDSLSYDSVMTSEDYDRLTFGLTLYAMRTEGCNFVRGTLTSVNKKGAVITDHYGAEYKFTNGITVIKGTETDNTFIGISSGSTVEAVYADDGTGIIAWEKRPNAMTINYLYKGRLYVNDEVGGNLIFKELSVLRGDTWVKISDRYLTAAVCDETLLILDGKKASVKDINRLYLDKEASVIVGEKNDKICVLYVLFE